MNRSTHTPPSFATHPVPFECSLCGGHHLSGSWLVSGPVGSAPMLWVCLDCQHRLARAIQELAGYQELSTAQRYMHLSPAAMEGASRLLDQPAPSFDGGEDTSSYGDEKTNVLT